MLAVLTDILQN